MVRNDPDDISLVVKLQRRGHFLFAAFERPAKQNSECWFQMLYYFKQSKQSYEARAAGAHF